MALLVVLPAGGVAVALSSALFVILTKAIVGNIIPFCLGVGLLYMITFGAIPWGLIWFPSYVHSQLMRRLSRGSLIIFAATFTAVFALGVCSAVVTSHHGPTKFLVELILLVMTSFGFVQGAVQGALFRPALNHFRRRTTPLAT